MPTGRLLSLIVPAYNEQENIEPFYRRAVSAFDGSGFDLQIIFINDGSSDGTLSQMQAVGRGVLPDWVEVDVVGFSRNFGKEAALYAGLKQAIGDYCCFIDSDLQQQPETARAMLEALISSPQYDVVAAYQEKRGGSSVTAWFSSLFYKVLGKASGMSDIVADASDFRVFRRTVADALIGMSEYYRFSKGLFAWIGFNTLPYPYKADERNAGETSWSFWKLVRYALNGIMSFTTVPLKLATYLGLFTSLAAVIYLVVVVAQRLAFGVDVPGYATIVTLVLLLGGMQLLVLGVMGEYLARVYTQGKNRPIYIARTIDEYGRSDGKIDEGNNRA